MITNVYALYDQKAEYYGYPYPAKTDADATRIFQGAIDAGGSLISEHPSDFTLYLLGTFNDVSGLMETLIPAKFVFKGTKGTYPHSAIPEEEK